GRDDEEELRRLAEARDALLDAVADTPVGLVALLDRIAPQVYSRAELAEQLTGLVAEGAIAESTGPDGEPLFSRTTPKVPRTPRVELDSELLEASLARREAPGETPESDGVLEGD
ncbi:MAG TPA: hypothetical protein VJS68_00425, partial [Thermoplasmata archaeon]|nr:hypothetical protein [Thermoplasmata archaeon]